MPDYGQSIRFGTFITPVNRPTQAPVELAVLSEELGYDLVTFQDHPYQPSFHDTWTLLTWVASRTKRIAVSGNVLNLPLRPPAVLARAAASLDLLSEGRYAMGLGAGGFPDAIEAMGGPRLTPGDRVDALGEAIYLVRAMWAADEPGGVRSTGPHYSVHGAKRGPRPAHQIPIWLGAYKPQMLRLVGRKADGWLPSLGHMQHDDLTTASHIIDEAAHAVGRNPATIVRLLNIGPTGSTASAWAQQLTSLALDHGFSTFILASDDPRILTQFTHEIAPAVREAVAAERIKRGR